MAQIQIPNLPAAIAVTGVELIEIVQAGVSSRASLSQIAMLAAPTAGSASQKQIRAWAAATGFPPYIYTIDNACPADIANTINIEWLHGNTMAVGDALYLFIQATLGFTSSQMLAAYTAMLTYPP